VKYSIIRSFFILAFGSWGLLNSSCGFHPGERYPEHAEKSRIITSGKDTRPVQITAKQAPSITDYEELKSLSLSPNDRDSALSQKLDNLFHTTFIENYSQKTPLYHTIPEVGRHLRVTSWNTEQSRQIQLLLNDLVDTKSYLKTQQHSEKDIAHALRQRQYIKQSDILILQEMDVGHPRSSYLHTPQAMAKTLGMNYAYGVQYLEVDPVYLGIDDDHIKNKDALRQASIVDPADRDKYRGLFGNAVLSRYPIKHAEIIPLKGVNYDWYFEEAKAYDFVETTRRTASHLLFKQRPRRELKIGSRAFLRVDLHIPALPLETLTVINVHLEIKLSVTQRRAQLEEILQQIKDIPNPVVLAGDFNSSVFDIGPTSFVKEVNKTVTTPKGLGNLALSLAQITPVTRLKDVINFFKNQQDPLAGHVPIIFENLQRETFHTLRDFRFDDGGAFDFRGDEAFSLGKAGVLSNSNQRCPKGFVSTFSVARPIGAVGREKLDWILVKSFLQAPFDANGSRRLAPQFGETLKAFNRSKTHHYSDHDPITVILPLDEKHQEVPSSGTK